jgi:phenylpyruvate tautomerase PptA (4-oxalocrotonate tautomerase family)
MPCVRIAIGLWSAGPELALIDAVQSALVAVFRLPEVDRDVVVDLYGDARRIVPAGRSERYTRVEIICIASRSAEAKRALFRTIVDGLERLGVPRLENRIVLIEPWPENWGVKGGIPASEADLGFKIEV